MSTHGLQWYAHCVNAGSLDALSGDWGADVLRISMYIQEGGYETDPAGFRARAEGIADAAIARGMYVLLDWHMLNPGDPFYNLDRAQEYFAHMAARYGATPNVLYEIANEPNGVSWSTIKSYAERVIPVIRAHDPDGIVIVGTRGWSSLGLSEGSGPAEVVSDPVNGANLMYAFHFYAASHGGSFREALAWAADRIPMFVTEFGTQQFTGDGPNDFTSAQAYLDLMAARKIGWVAWNFSDDARSGAVLVPGTCPNGPWAGAALKPAGEWVRERMRTPVDAF
jgi:endoglucanase